MSDDYTNPNPARPDRTQDHLEEIDTILNDVREHLTFSKEQGEIYELQALQLLLRVTKALHSQHNVHTLLTLILDSAIAFAEADRAFLMLVGDHANGDAERLRFKMGRLHTGSYLSPADFVISQSVVHEVVASLKPLILADARTNSQFNERTSIQDLELRTIMAAPLLRETDLLGLIYVDSKRPLARYSRHHLNVLTSLAEQAAVAIFNARKFETHTG